MDLISKQPAELLANIMLYKDYKCFKGVKNRAQRFQQSKGNPASFRTINKFQIGAYSLHC